MYAKAFFDDMMGISELSGSNVAFRMLTDLTNQYLSDFEDDNASLKDNEEPQESETEESSD